MWSDRRRLILCLAGSLLVNVFLLGLVVGHGFVRKGRKLVAPAPLAASRYVDALPPDQKEIFQAAMAAHHPAIRAARRNHRALRAKVEADVSAPNFDRAAVAADLTALHQSNRAIEEATSAALLDALAGLSPASRAALVGRTPEAPTKP